MRATTVGLEVWNSVVSSVNFDLIIDSIEQGIWDFLGATLAEHHRLLGSIGGWDATSAESLHRRVALAEVAHIYLRFLVSHGAWLLECGLWLEVSARHALHLVGNNLV